MILAGLTNKIGIAIGIAIEGFKSLHSYIMG